MVYVKKNKIKKKYICPNCLKDFGNLKYQLELHLNRVNSCKKNKSNRQFGDLPIKIISDDNNNNNNDNLNLNLEIKPIFFTDKNIIFNDTYNTNSTLDDYSNKKYENIIIDEKQNNNFDNNSNLIFELMKKMDLVIKQNEKMNIDIQNLSNEIVELKKDNVKLKNQIILSNDNTKTINNNNCINVNIQINNFNDTNDFKGNFNNLLKETGKYIYLKTIENIFLNPKKPENHNIYIADKNRGYAKIYNDGRWQTQNINIIKVYFS